MPKIFAEINFRMRGHEKVKHAFEYTLQLSRTVKGFDIHTITLSKENVSSLSPLVLGFYRAERTENIEVAVAQTLWSNLKNIGAPSVVFLARFSSVKALQTVKKALQHEDIVFDITIL